MSCRTNRGSSAVTSYARSISNSTVASGADGSGNGNGNGNGNGAGGLGDMQNLSLFHQLVRQGESNNSPAPSPDEVGQWLQNFQNEVRNNTALSDSQRQRILQRVDNLDGQSMPNGAMFYAWQQITPQAQTTSHLIDRAYNSLATDLGVDRETLQNRIRQYEREYQEQPNRRSRPENTALVLEGFRQRGNGNIISSTSTDGGVARGGNNATATAAAATDTPTPSFLPQDPTTVAVWSRLMSEANATVRENRNNVNANNETEVVGVAAQRPQQCPNCGQFMGANHICGANTAAAATTAITTDTMLNSGEDANNSGAFTRRPAASANNNMDIVAFGYNPNRELLELEFPRVIEPDGTVTTDYRPDPQTGISRAVTRPALETEPNQVLLFRGVPPETIAEIEDSNGAVLNPRFYIENLHPYRAGQEDAAPTSANQSSPNTSAAVAAPASGTRRQQIQGSSVINAVGYDPARRTLEVEFHGGRLYQYEGVPPEILAALTRPGASAGRVYSAQVRGQYPSRLLTAEETSAGSSSITTPATNTADNGNTTATTAIAADSPNRPGGMTGHRMNRDGLVTELRPRVETATNGQVTPTLSTEREASEQEQTTARRERQVAEAEARAGAGVEVSADAAATPTSSPRYSENMEAFQAAYNEAKARKERGEPPIPYLTENATGGLGARNGGRGFGVELEFDFEAGVDRYTANQNIARDLHQAGLLQSPVQAGYHADAVFNRQTGESETPPSAYLRWRFERDQTVSGEIISPIMYDEPQSWEQLQKVADIIKRNGGRATVRTGGHVHVACDNYDHSPKNHNNLLRLFKRNEDNLYRLASNPKRGRHRGTDWCSPNSVPAQDYTEVSRVRGSNDSHNIGLNFHAVKGTEHDHVEYRMWDGSLDPAVIQSQIKVSLAMTEAAFRAEAGTFTATQPEAVGQHQRYNREHYGQPRQLRGTAWERDTQGFREMADTLFTREEDKKQLTALFAITKWQKS